MAVSEGTSTVLRSFFGRRPPSENFSSLAIDGTAVGEVAAITMRADGDFAEIRIAVESPLGIGKRIVIIPPTSFMIRRGAVVLDLSPTDVEALPTSQ